MHASPGKHSFAWQQRKFDYQTDTQTETDRQTPNKVIPKCRYASQATQLNPHENFLIYGIQTQVSWRFLKNQFVRYFKNIVAAFRGMHVSPVKHSCYGWLPRKCDYQTDRQMPDKVIPMCRYASQATQQTENTSSFLKKNYTKSWQDLRYQPIMLLSMVSSKATSPEERE